MDYKGTRWYKTDLHVHTPASNCFNNREVTAEQWVKRCIEQELNVVAVTDHNTGQWIDEIKKAAESTDLVVFPGVEVTCSESKVHMLVLFDTDKTRQDIEDFLIKIEINRNEFASSEANSSLTTIQLVEEASLLGAIVIPAHIDEYNGISEITYNNRKSLFENNNVNAVQVVHKMFLNPITPRDTIEESLYRYYQKSISEDLYKEWKVSVKQALNHNKTILTFSDNPCEPGNPKHGLWGIGQRFTWIKMNEKVNLESLKQALFLPEHRIRNDFEGGSVPYTLPDYWIKGMVAKNTVLNSGEIKLDFSPQMTTIIGGRGTGKSSIIRFIRGVFQKNDDLKTADLIGGSNLKKEQDDFFKVKNTNGGVILKDSVIEIIVSKYGTEYTLIATDFNNQEPKSIQVFKKDKMGKGLLQEVTNLNDFFRYDVYSQKQIFEIAKYPNALRDRIDNSIPEMESLNNLLKSKKNDFMEQSAKVRSLEFNISKKSKILLDIKDKKGQIDSFRESGFEGLVHKFKTFSKEESLLEEITVTLDSKKGEINSLLNEFNLQKFQVESFGEIYQSEIQTLISPVFKEFEIIKCLLQDARTKLEKIKAAYVESLEEISWSNDRIENAVEFKKTKESLAEKGIDDLNKLEIATIELSKLEGDLKNINVYENDLKNQYDKREIIYAEFIELREKITYLRKGFLDDVLDDDNIKIEIKPYRDKKYYIKRFREIIQKETNYIDDIKKIEEMCFRDQKVIHNQQGLFNVLVGIRNNNNNSEFGGRFVNVIKDLNEAQIDEIKLLLPEDEITVKYRSNKSRGFQLLSNASAGQKTSAILTFLLSYGDIPLILDQPEDDLDNRLIYELIVDRLKVVKNNRQIIIVTHNANIPVNGDTEWLIAMNSKARNIETLCEGTIEDVEIRTEICDVMEGGQDAFKLRAKRYSL